MSRIFTLFIVCSTFTFHSNAAKADDIKTFFTIQNAQNLTTNTWTTELLDYQAKYLDESGSLAAKQGYLSHGGNAIDWNYSSTHESNFVFNNGEKFGIIKSQQVISPRNTNTVGITNIIKVSVIRGADMLSVTCARPSAAQISLADGPCDEAIRKNLGVSFSVATNNEAPSRAALAIAAGTSSFAKTMLFVLAGIAVLSIPTLWILRKPKNDASSKAFREGHLAFQNELAEDSNPYSEADKKLFDSWLAGYKNALKHRQNRER